MDVSEADITSDLLASNLCLEICHCEDSRNLLVHGPLVSRIARVFKGQVIETVANHCQRVVRDHVAHADEVEVHASQIVLVWDRYEIGKSVESHEVVFG